MLVHILAGISTVSVRHWQGKELLLNFDLETGLPLTETEPLGPIVLHSLHFARGHWRFGRQRQICGWGYWIWLRKRYTTDPWNRHVRGAARPTPDSGTSTTGTGPQAPASLTTNSLVSGASLHVRRSSSWEEERRKRSRGVRRRRMGISSFGCPSPHPLMTVIVHARWWQYIHIINC